MAEMGTVAQRWATLGVSRVAVGVQCWGRHCWWRGGSVGWLGGVAVGADVAVGDGGTGVRSHKERVTPTGAWQPWGWEEQLPGAIT